MTFSIDQFRLDGKVAVVTGAGGRGNSIGRAYAMGIAKAGASVVVADRNEAGAKAVAEEIKAAGGKAIATGVDITKEDQAQRMAQAAVETFGGVDILVNNAALMVEVAGSNMLEAPISEWDNMVSVNVTGALICTRAVLPSMRQRGGGKIINQLSGGAFPAQSAYGVTKLALYGLTTTLARQLGPEKINVNAIAPGNVTSGAGNLLVPDDSPFIQFLQMTCPIRPRGAPDDLVGPLLLLCSPAGDWITGQVLHVDGGWVMRP
jgi:NAD(P)-dependent dehydrogenase (short-subunit alcohol dehydrogenase family)